MRNPKTHALHLSLGSKKNWLTRTDVKDNSLALIYEGLCECGGVWMYGYVGGVGVLQLSEWF